MKHLLMVLFGLFLLSCQPENPQPNNTTSTGNNTNNNNNNNGGNTTQSLTPIETGLLGIWYADSTEQHYANGNLFQTLAPPFYKIDLKSEEDTNTTYTYQMLNTTPVIIGRKCNVYHNSSSDIYSNGIWYVQDYGNGVYKLTVAAIYSGELINYDVNSFLEIKHSSGVYYYYLHR